MTPPLDYMTLTTAEIASGKSLEEIEADRAQPFEEPPEEPPPPKEERLRVVGDDEWQPRWARVDVGPVLDGTWQPPLPTVGNCHRAPGLLYPGRRHDVYSESEAGKTWLGLRMCADEMAKGNAAVFLDFEDDVGGIVSRLMGMDIPHPQIRDRFAYLRPEGRLDHAEAEVVRQMLGDLKPTLVVLDGRTEAMAMHGLKLIDNDDVAKYGRTIERPFTLNGRALLALDHVVKDREQRGRYGIGGIHKLNGLNGAAFVLENRAPIGRGVVGRSTLRISKDRPGQLRQYGLPGKESVWLADLTIDATTSGYTDVLLVEPQERGETFRPTGLMKRISATMASATGSEFMTQNAILMATTGNREKLTQALNVLIAEGYVERLTTEGGTFRHRYARPFNG